MQHPRHPHQERGTLCLGAGRVDGEAGQGGRKREVEARDGLQPRAKVEEGFRAVGGRVFAAVVVQSAVVVDLIRAAWEHRVSVLGG